MIHLIFGRHSSHGEGNTGENDTEIRVSKEGNVFWTKQLPLNEKINWLEDGLPFSISNQGQQMWQPETPTQKVFTFKEKSF
jgi:hypothetical protein